MKRENRSRLYVSKRLPNNSLDYFYVTVSKDRVTEAVQNYKARGYTVLLI